jgi:glycosyltransferase involved in cell wall biosynthesis
MNILYVWDSEYPWDVRTEKICLALTKAGHKVSITARNRAGDARQTSLPEGVVERLPPFQIPGGGFLSFPAFLNPVWLWHLDRMLRRHRIDLVVCRDLPLGQAALWVARRRCPVILDMAENYPAMLADIWKDGRARRTDVVVRNPRIAARLERWILPRFTHVLTVVEESRERVARLGVPVDRISVVSNTPPLDRIAPLRDRQATEPLRVVYLGLMERHRGVGDLLEAIASLVTSGVPLRCDLVGDGRDGDEFRRRAVALGLQEPQIRFHGRLPHAEALEIMACAHVGVVPHHATESWNTTIANKLFDYMAAGLAVVTSDAIPSARITRETGAGLVFQSGDPATLLQCIRDLLDIPLWDRCRRRGQEAVRTIFNWENDASVLLGVVEAAGSGRSVRVRHDVEVIA